MTQPIKLSNGDILNFPDGMSDDQMHEAIQKEYGKYKQNTERQQMEYLIGANRTPIDTFRDLAQGVLTGLGKGGQSIASILTGGHSPTVNMDEIYSGIGSPNKSMGGNIVKGIGEYLPYGIAGGASLPGQLLAGAAYGAATTEPEESNLLGLLPQGKLGGALKGAGINLAGAGIGKLINSLRTSQMFKSPLSQEELQQNLKSAEGTPTGIGDIIASPFLKRQYENVLSKLPFSGATEKLQQAGQIVKQKGNELLSNMLGNNNTENITDKLTESLIGQHKVHELKKNSLYNKTNEIAENEKNFKLELPSFSKKAQDYMDAIESTNILKFEPDIRNIFNKLKNYANPVKETSNANGILDQFGKPITSLNYPSLKEANLLKGKLNNYARIASKNPDPTQRGMAKVFGELSSSIKNDILDSIDKSGNEKLKLSYTNSENNYAKSFSQFLDKDIYKYTHGNADPDTLVQHFLKTSKSSDRNNLLSKLMDKLPENEKKLMGYSYFARSLDNEGNINLGKLSTLINNIGKKQLKTLIPDKVMREKIRDFNKLYKMNFKSVNLMQNPSTGQQALDVIPSVLAHAGAGMGGLKGALAGVLMPGFISKPLVNWMTSPEIRKSLVDAMIKNKQWNKTITPGLQYGMQGMQNQ